LDRQVLAAVSIAGVSLDRLGGMYLACDLFGGKQSSCAHSRWGRVFRSFFGVALILSGFGLQSIQYWVTLLDGPLR